MYLPSIPNRKTGPEAWAANRKRAWQLIIWRLLLALVVMPVGGAVPIAYADLHPGDCYDAESGELLDEACLGMRIKQLSDLAGPDSSIEGELCQR